MGETADYADELMQNAEMDREREEQLQRPAGDVTLHHRRHCMRESEQRVEDEQLGRLVEDDRGPVRKGLSDGAQSLPDESNGRR